MTLQSRDERVFEEVKQVITSHGLPLRLIPKDESPLMKFCNVFVGLFNSQFMTEYTTTIAFLGRIYTPTKWYAGAEWRTLAHEGVHLVQAKRDGQLLFSLKYLFPQCLAPLALLAIGAIWWMPMLFALLFLLFLAPLPAPWRVRYEREAYRVSAACDKLIGFDITSKLYVDYMQHHYTGWGYYRPAWSRVEGIEDDMKRAEALADDDLLYSHVTPYSAAVIWAIKTELDKR